jgi:hypothetical protein
MALTMGDLKAFVALQDFKLELYIYVYKHYKSLSYVMLCLVFVRDPWNTLKPTIAHRTSLFRVQ